MARQSGFSRVFLAGMALLLAAGAGLALVLTGAYDDGPAAGLELASLVLAAVALLTVAVLPPTVGGGRRSRPSPGLLAALGGGALLLVALVLGLTGRSDEIAIFEGVALVTTVLLVLELRRVAAATTSTAR